MRSALDFLSELDAETVRQVHSGDVTRDVLSHMADEAGFPPSAGEYAHRFVRGHDSPEPVVDNYIRKALHHESADESDAVSRIEGNTVAADLDVLYPHGPPITSKNELFDRLGLDQLDTDQWELDGGDVGHWGGQQQIGAKGEESVVYLNLYKGEVSFQRKTRQPEFEPPQPVHCEPPPVDPPEVDVGERLCPDSWKTALVWSDTHYGVKRDELTGDLLPIHDRHAIDLVKQVAALADIDTLAFCGDGIDAPAISDYVGTPDLTRTLQPSLVELDYDWAQIRHAAQPDEEYYIEGNHDERVREALLKTAPELYGIRDVEAIKEDRPPQLSLKSLLRLNEKGVEWRGDYPDGEVLLNEGVELSHDWTLSSKSGKTVYQMIRDQNGEVSRIQGHGHRHEVAWKTNWKGRRRAEYFSAMLGCLCRLDGIVEGTQAKQNWQQSFGLLHYDPNGWHHTFEPIKILPSRRDDNTKECDFRNRRLQSREPDLGRLTEETGVRFTQSDM